MSDKTEIPKNYHKEVTHHKPAKKSIYESRRHKTRKHINAKKHRAKFERSLESGSDEKSQDTEGENI